MKRIGEAMTRKRKKFKGKFWVNMNWIRDADYDRYIHGHHEDYKKPLEVVWVCFACHAIRHRRIAA